MYEVYALLGEVRGSGCPLGYLLLQTKADATKKEKEGGKERYLTEFLRHFYGIIDAKVTLTDKDRSEINAFLKVYPDAKYQLCLWHVLRAFKTRLSILRRQPGHLDVEPIRAEFGDLIDRDFVPLAQLTPAMVS